MSDAKDQIRRGGKVAKAAKYFNLAKDWLQTAQRDLEHGDRLDAIDSMEIALEYLKKSRKATYGT